MKIVISPAKSLDLTSELPTDTYTQSQFLAQSEVLNKEIKSKKPSELSSLMHISEKLAALNWQRNQDWTLPFTAENARPAVFMFNGDVYNGLDAYQLSKENIQKMQDKLRILSGLYGLLKPLDLIQPYRLEMGTKFGANGAKNLYEFWKKTITVQLNTELEKDELFVNLASNEYFKAIDKKMLKVPVITPVFKDWKNDKLKIISFYAKKARGTMSRYLIENEVENLNQLKGFSLDGYAYSETYTTKENEPVFVR
ncbi:peroxide stress protein YaaA [Aquimarina agarivorans]|uniref:peroxide stress protein YaaA n=1 Tax=Aquimarina agarivorans TaxID=980584 RepID=UPI000248E847|nr:peroxide stress protein YaaA [Aquimarina agarivorans]